MSRAASETDGSRTRTGLAAGFGAYLLWGAMPLYFLAMAPAGPFEIVAWRVVFALVFCVLLLTSTRSWRALGGVLRSPRTTLVIGAAGLLIYVNWLTYVIATTTGHVVEAALGYFINPIVTVLLGVLLLGERLRRMQWTAVALSGVAVVVLAVGYGQVPWVSLLLAFSFGFYGLIKKHLGGAVTPLTGLALETAWLLPVAIAQLLVVQITSGVVFGSAGVGNVLWIISLGVGTAVPLLLFAAATSRLPLSVVGFIQYLTPVLQFLLGVLVLGESMPPERLAGFAIVWLALVLLVVDAMRRSQGAARLRAAPHV